jgi:tyrosine-protein phosphatase YwqE
VIAHPERHASADLFTRLHELVERGALVQATAAYFTHPSTREGMFALARAGLVHVLGSDAHSSHAGRPVALRTGYDALREVEPTGFHIEWLLDTAPRAIVEGLELRPPF